MRLPNTPLRPADYIPRLMDERIERLLDSYTVVEIEGMHGCGKSWTSLAHAQSATKADDTAIVLPILQTDPRIALSGLRPHVIDEWAVLPRLREYAYREAEAKGTFILVSSFRAEPEGYYLRDHSRMGARVRMRTLSLSEQRLSDQSVSLRQLLEGRFAPITSHAGLEKMAEAACSGGWPRALGLDGAAARNVARIQADAILANSAPSLGRKEAVARRMLGAMADSTGLDATYQRISSLMARDGSKPPSRNTVLAYERALQDLFLVEPISGWAAPVRSASRVKTKPRFYLADPSLGTAVLGLEPSDLLANAQVFLSAFKTLVHHELLVYSDMLNGARLCYYADADGLEVDFVLLLGDGRWAAINAEIGEAQVAKSIKRLERLRRKVAGGGSEMGEPAFTAVIVSATSTPRQDEMSGTYVFPLISLKA